jgi:glycosyltransferase involved in cell wall biosynthesis
VARRLADTHGIPQGKITALFHPDLDYRSVGAPQMNEHDPLRVVFIGRLLPYKGLAVLVDAVEHLRRQGIIVRLGVYGRGTIERALTHRLAALGAQVVTRWLSHDEMASILSRYDLVAATHTEASQSGVIAAAFGAGVPVIATPVGGLVEQVTPGVTGIVADRVTAGAVAEAIRQVAEDRPLLLRLRKHVVSTRSRRSMDRFFEQICAIARAGRP